MRILRNYLRHIKEQRDWREDNEILDMMLLLGYTLADEKIFWAKFEDELGITDRYKLKQEVLKHHRKALKDWKAGKPI